MKALFVGCGSIGRRHIKNLALLCQGDLVLDAMRHSSSPLHDSVKGLVAHEYHNWDDVPRDYDFAFITNPTSEHLQATRNVADRCKLIFLEKPVAGDCAQAELLRTAAGATPCYVACPLRYTNVLQFAKELAAKERVLSVQAISSSYLPDWRPGQDYRETYSAIASQGGGVRVDLIHEWDYLVWLFGLPEIVNCRYGKASNLEIDTEDFAFYIASYQHMNIELHLDYFGRHTIREMRMMTELHTYVFDIANARVSCDGAVIREWDEKPNDKYLREMESFLAIYEGECNQNTVDRAIEVLEICLGNARDNSSVAEVLGHEEA